MGTRAEGKIRTNFRFIRASENQTTDVYMYSRRFSQIFLLLRKESRYNVLFVRETRWEPDCCCGTLLAILYFCDSSVNNSSQWIGGIFHCIRSRDGIGKFDQPLYAFTFFHCKNVANPKFLPHAAMVVWHLIPLYSRYRAYRIVLRKLP